MRQHLVITVRLYEGRYHGRGEWRPSPARLFQAVVAGVARGEMLDDGAEALSWLEGLAPPTIGLPPMTTGRRFATFVPDNDVDTVGGNVGRLGEIRSSKVIEPQFFDATIPFLYVWEVGDEEEAERHAQTVCAAAARVYQFGRGVDMAWACGEVLDDEGFEALISQYPGVVYRPSISGAGNVLPCPMRGSLKSLKERHEAGRRRFQTAAEGKTVRQLFSQPPKPRFRQVAYESPPSRRVYELRELDQTGSFAVWPLPQASRLVVALRTAAVRRLQPALPGRSGEIERILVGRKADGSNDGPTSLRVRIVPLPSIGHRYADHGIRRVLVEIPAGCPLRADDVHWAFSGVEPVDPDTGELLPILLIPAEDETMPGHYGVGERGAFRVWRTVTPAALPTTAARRRIDPARRLEEAKSGEERAAEQARAVASVAQALRHADVRACPESVRVQREPFEAKGQRAAAFTEGTRFTKERLWHVEIAFASPVAGPLVVGDGRFLGLGVMAPVRQALGIHAFEIKDGLLPGAQSAEVTRALRRAVMARVQEILGPNTRRLPAFFAGHETDGSPAQRERHPHLSFAFDPVGKRLLVIAPHVVQGREASGDERQYLRTLDDALSGLRELRAGAAGLLTLGSSAIDADSDPLLRPSQTWESVTPYQVNRHAKHVGVSEALARDIRTECLRQGLPEPSVTALEVRGVPGVGLTGSAQLAFQVAVPGPILLGRNRYYGGGMFRSKG